MSPTFRVIAGAMIVAVVIAVVVWALHRPAEPIKPQSSVPPPSAVVPHPPVVTLASNAPPSAPVRPPPMANYPDFQLRPFPMAYESAKNQWTLADGKDTNVIRQLAHNPLEYDRMVEENPRIFKRQLVYLKETAASVFEQAKLAGQPVEQLTLPGVDGQELSFQIVQREGNGSSRQGQFSGHLADDPDSLVTMAFADGREAFTILSPKEKIFVVGEPREDGQIIVKAIDPNTYGVGPQETGDDSIPAPPTNK